MRGFGEDLGSPVKEFFAICAVAVPCIHLTAIVVSPNGYDITFSETFCIDIYVSCIDRHGLCFVAIEYDMCIEVRKIRDSGQCQESRFHIEVGDLSNDANFLWLMGRSFRVLDWERCRVQHDQGHVNNLKNSGCSGQ